MPEETIELEYDLHSLPTAQHKAGLAGLCVLHNTLERRKIEPLPKLSVSNDGIVSLLISKSSLKTLFNELFDAAWEEAESKSKWTDATLIREEFRSITDSKTGKTKDQKYFVYNRVVPKAAFLDALQVPEPWLKLWRDAVWGTLRGKPLTRTPYNERADGKPVKEAEKAWKSLKKPFSTEDIASSVYIGAQAKNAEKVPFVGRNDENFLLHFWQVVMRIFVPEVINNDGKSEFRGYVLAIPEVCDIEGFVDDYSLMLSQLKENLRGYRPAESVISVPQEGALEYIAALVRNKAQDGNLAYNISSVEVVHLEKRGNNIAILSSGRLTVDDTMRSKYESIRSSRYNHPVFKLQLIRNLLDRKEWYSGFDKVLSSHDQDWFVGFKTWFPIDVDRHFRLMNQ